MQLKQILPQNSSHP